MRSVGIIHYTSYPIIGGVEKVIKEHSRYFISYGYPVKIITGRGEKFHENLEVEEIPEIASFHLLVKEMNKELQNGRMEKFNELSSYLTEKLNKAIGDRDIVIIHNCLTMHFNLALTFALHKVIEMNKNKKFICWAHDATFVDPNYSDKQIDKFPFNIISRPISNVKYVTISKRMQKKLSQLFNIPEEEIEVVPNGIDFFELLEVSELCKEIIQEYDLLNSLVLLYPTRIVKRKNIEDAIKIVKKLNEVQKTKLIITGAPDPHNEESIQYYKKLHEYCDELGLSKNVIFLRDYKNIYVDDKLVYDLYKISDILIFTSEQEGFGIPILEGAVFKLPMIVNKIEPLTELVNDSEVIFLTDIDNATKRLKNLIKNPKFLLHKKIIQNYHWSKIFENHILKLMK